MKAKNYFLILSLNISILINFTPQDLTLRRVRDLQPPALTQDFTIPLIALLTDKIRELDGIEVMEKYRDCTGLITKLVAEFDAIARGPELQKTVSEAWKAGLRMGFILAVLKDKDMEALGLNSVNISRWLQENASALLENIPEFRNVARFTSDAASAVRLTHTILSELSAIHFEELSHHHKDSASLRYEGIRQAIINYYFLTFVQKAESLAELPETDVACDLWLFEKILALHSFRTSSSPNIVLPFDYCPDLWRLGELKDPEAKRKEIEGYLLGKLIEFQLLGYAQCLIGEREKQRLGSRWDESIFLKELESGRFNSEIARFTEEHYPHIKRIAWSAFNFRPHFTNGQPLIDTLPISLGEDLVRKIIALYFKNSAELKESPAYGTTSDPFYYLNEVRNKHAYEAWGIVLEKIEGIKSGYNNPEHPDCKKDIIRYLFKILAISGAFDLSVDTLRERVKQEGFRAIIKDCLDPRAHPFIIRSFNKFFKDVAFNTEQKIKLVISADNHGEIIYLLGVIQYLLEKVNPNLYIYLVPRGIPVADDVYYDAVKKILEKDAPQTGGKNHFDFLRRQLGLSDFDAHKRFRLVPDGPDIQGVVLNSLSSSEGRALSETFLGRDSAGRSVFCDRIVYLGIGNANFISTQGLNISGEVPFDRYYLFRVKAERVSEATGIPKNPPSHIPYPLVFAYVERGVCIGTSFGEKVYETLLQYEHEHACRDKGYFDLLTEHLKALKLRWRTGG